MNQLKQDKNMGNVNSNSKKKNEDTYYPLINQCIDSEGLRHIAFEIFACIANEDIPKCRLVCKTWLFFIDEVLKIWWQIQIRKCAEKCPKFLIDHNIDKYLALCHSLPLDLHFNAKLPWGLDTTTFYRLRGKLALEDLIEHFLTKESPQNMKKFNSLLRSWIKSRKESDLLLYVLEENNLEWIELLAKVQGSGYISRRLYSWDETPLHNACHQGNIEVVEMLVKYLDSNGLNARDRSGKTPLHAACSTMNCGSIQAFEIVQILLSNGKGKGIDVNPVDIGGYTPADCAFECGNVELLQFFKDV